MARRIKSWEQMMDFALYLQALNRRLIASGRHEADEQRAKEYFHGRLPIEQATSLEAVEQELEARTISLKIITKPHRPCGRFATTRALSGLSGRCRRKTESMNDLSSDSVPMSTLEIAELTGKRHGNVLRDAGRDAGGSRRRHSSQI